MKAINATPKSVREIFYNNSYLIPDFQRPYSWEVDHCDTLWGDLINFHSQLTNNNTNDKYFLGNIVIHKPNEADRYFVIDGQQRLTTLLLLIKALHSKANTFKALEACLFVKDKRTDTLTKEVTVLSEVSKRDSIILNEIINNKQFESNNKSNFILNYNRFIYKIDLWLNEQNEQKELNTKDYNSEKFDKLILTLLDKFVLLPILCETEDDALTIFETINNRGMSLRDSDIFKAKLYKNIPNDKKSYFINVWNGFAEPLQLFRILMHIIRAKNNITSWEIGLRPFFTSPIKDSESLVKPLDDWTSVISDLKLINSIDNNWPDKVDMETINSLWRIIDTYPNKYWKYPLYVFLHKYGEYTEDNVFMLSERYKESLEKLLSIMIKYYFIKGIVYNYVDSVKDTTFKVCAAISNDEDYLSKFENNIVEKEILDFFSMLNSNIYGQYSRGIFLLAAYLNPAQNRDKFAKVIYSKDTYHMEHILPKEWNNYDGWTVENYNKYLDCLGNLIPLEKILNIKASNEYFKKKKNNYKTSGIQDAIDLTKISDNGWTPERVEEEKLKKIGRIKQFFQID
ncbi:MAG: DUF262 domain-containing HNH endonuclease family protein [Deltaproteobacteria bacterium]|jgi:hypothetical protein|nr:DUF262 domain-containing HNH endonuclease family protein [Deltaproteobacteria bacterium]